MKRLTATEIGLLILAGLFLVIGFVSITKPHDMTAFHQTGDATGGGSWAFVEVITKNGARIYGAILISFAIGIAAFIFYREEK